MNKSCGSDIINSQLVKKEGAPLISQHLSYIFNNSICLYVFPKTWKVANVTPVHKKGDITDVTNYRPISLLSSIDKVLKGVFLSICTNL